MSELDGMDAFTTLLDRYEELLKTSAGMQERVHEAQNNERIAREENKQLHRNLSDARDALKKSDKIGGEIIAAFDVWDGVDGNTAPETKAAAGEKLNTALKTGRDHFDEIPF